MLPIFLSRSGRDVTNQTLPGREKFNCSRPGRVWLVTSRAGDGKIANLFLQCIVAIEYCSSLVGSCLLGLSVNRLFLTVSKALVYEPLIFLFMGENVYFCGQKSPCWWNKVPLYEILFLVDKIFWFVDKMLLFCG